MYQAMRGVSPPTPHPADVALPFTWPHKRQPLWLLSFFNKWILLFTRTLFIITRLGPLLLQAITARLDVIDENCYTK